MLKILIFITICATCCAEIASWNTDKTEFNLNNKHYSQHEASVNAARKGASERLAKHGSSSSYVNHIQPGYGSAVGDAELLNAGCSVDCNAESVGHGVVGFSSGSESSSNSRFSSSGRHERVQTLPIQIYPSSSSSKSSYAAANQRESSSLLQPVAVYPTRGEQISSKYSSSNQRQSASISQPISYPINSESSRYSTSGRHENSQRLVPVSIYPASSSERLSSQAATFSERKAVPIYKPLPSSTYVVYGDRSAVSGIQTIPVYNPSYASNSQSRFSDKEESSSYVPVHTVYPIYPVASESSKYSARQDASSQIRGSQPYLNQENTGRANTHYIPIRVQIVPASSKYASTNQEEHISNARTNNFVPAVPAESLSASSSQYSNHRTGHSSTYQPVPVVSTGLASQYSASNSETQEQRREVYQPIPLESQSHIVPVPVVSGSSSKYSSAQNERQTSSYVPVPVVGGSSSSSQYASQNQRQTNSYAPLSIGSSSSQYSDSQQKLSEAESRQIGSRGSGSSYYNQGKANGFSTYPITNDHLGSRFGAGELGAGNDLTDFMSESERLAKVQANNVYSSNAPIAGSAVVDSGFEAGSGVDNGGFQRAKSWASSSKWASGQQYDDGGKPKTYSMLSTAESEHHNIDGKETGYKAATTTLEDDGKVSTYSIHTP